MLSIQRQREILTYIASHKSVQVVELSDTFNASQATVRRDLRQLEEEGLIQRVHGGAVYIEPEAESPAMLRKSHQAAYKQRIGQAAAGLVQDGETIIITSGTTTEAMLPYLANKSNLTVITNALNIGYQLVRYPQISTVVLGGWLRHSEFSLLGHLTEQALHGLHADKIFHGVFGISPEHGLTGSYFQEAQTDKALINAARELIVLADHSKFEQVGPIQLASLDIISKVLTDTEAPEADIKALRSLGIMVMQV